MIEVNHSREVLISGCLAPSGTGVFAKLREMSQDDCALEGNDLRRAKQAVEWT